MYLHELSGGRKQKGWFLDDWANGEFDEVFFMHGMVLVPWGIGVILGNGYGI